MQSSRSVHPSHSYWAYGLHFQSEMAIPELPPDTHPEQGPDVRVRLLPPIQGPLAPGMDGHFEVKPTSFQLRVEGVAHYLLEEGKRITIQPLMDAQPEKIRLFLLGSTLGALLYQRGCFPLHGSAVETPWGAMLLVGNQGVGKSTLAAHFQRKGYRLLSDDVCAVVEGTPGLIVTPAYPQVRLCPDAFDRLGEPSGARFDVDKFVLPLGAGFRDQPMPLAAIHVLQDYEEALPRLESLRGFDRIRHLLENLYRPHYLPGQDTQGHLMIMAAQIASKAMVANVFRKRDASRIDALADFLLEDWSRRFSPIEL